MVPMKDVLGTIERAQTELTKAREEVGYLRGQLDAQHKQLTDAEATRQQLVAAQARIAQLEQDLQGRTPWWKRLLGRS
jgi:DNA repair exonuclease SbcCD ATPase subunit